RKPSSSRKRAAQVAGAADQGEALAIALTLHPHRLDLDVVPGSRQGRPWCGRSSLTCIRNPCARERGISSQFFGGWPTLSPSKSGLRNGGSGLADATRRNASRINASRIADINQPPWNKSNLDPPCPRGGWTFICPSRAPVGFGESCPGCGADWARVDRPCGRQ